MVLDEVVVDAEEVRKRCPLNECSYKSHTSKYCVEVCGPISNIVYSYLSDSKKVD